MVTGDCGPPHHHDNPELISMAGQFTDLFAVVGQSVKPSRKYEQSFISLWLHRAAGNTYADDSAKQTMTPRK